MSPTISLPPPFSPSTMTLPWHVSRARTPDFSKAGVTGTGSSASRRSERRVAAARSYTDAAVEAHSSSSFKRPRRATQRYEPASLSSSSLRPYEQPQSQHRRASCQTPATVESDDVPKKKKRVVRKGTCANCGCNQSETTLWRTNPLDRAASAGKYKAENLLCNACGIWTVTHGTPRPARYWETKRRPASPPEAEADTGQSTSSSISSSSDDQGLDLLEAAEALLGLKNQSHSPTLVISPAKHSLLSPVITASHSNILTNPPAPPLTHVSPKSRRMRSTSTNPQDRTRKPKKHRRAASPSMYTRSASAGCTSVPPSVRREQPRPILIQHASDPGSKILHLSM